MRPGSSKVLLTEAPNLAMQSIQYDRDTFCASIRSASDPDGNLRLRAPCGQTISPGTWLLCDPGENPLRIAVSSRSARGRRLTQQAVRSVCYDQGAI